jgi:hypothetical protein
MKKEIEQQIFEKMKAKDFGESMCNETKLSVLRWTMQQLRKHNVVGRSEQLVCDHPDEAIIKDKPTDYCLACNRNI